jgi:biotin carboxyl carrier protein
MTDLLTRMPPAPPATVADEAAAPGTALAGSVAHDLAVVVAPTTGRFRPAVEPGAAVVPGTVLGHVTGGGGRADAVVTPVAGLVADLLARPKQLVYRGQGLAWLQGDAVMEVA